MSPIATRVYTPVTVTPRQTSAMTLSGWSLICLPGTALLHATPTQFDHAGGGETRILPHAITEHFIANATGAFASATAGSTRAVVHSVKHAGFVTVVQYELRGALTRSGDKCCQEKLASRPDGRSSESGRTGHLNSSLSEQNDAYGGWCVSFWAPLARKKSARDQWSTARQDAATAVSRSNSIV